MARSRRRNRAGERLLLELKRILIDGAAMSVDEPTATSTPEFFAVMHNSTCPETC
jgi:hypothetical protein